MHRRGQHPQRCRQAEHLCLISGEEAAAILAHCHHHHAVGVITAGAALATVHTFQHLIICLSIPTILISLMPLQDIITAGAALATVVAPLGVAIGAALG